MSFAAVFLMPLGCAPLSAERPKAALARFPIGLYSVEDPDQLGPVQEAGFDAFVAAPSEDAKLPALAAAAKRRGMRMLVPVYRGPLEVPRSKTAGWPVDAWHLMDEPDVNDLSPEALRKRSEDVRAWDPQRLQSFVIGDAAAAARYADIADILMLDWYPVPHLKLDSVADQADAAVAALPPSKPFWMVLQAFDWKEEPQRDPSKPRVGRFPTHGEIRLMTYLAILHGAKGLFYFRLQHPAGGTLFDEPELWQAVTRVTQELKALQPMLEGGRAAILPFPPNPDSVEAKAWTFRGRTYVVILNRKEGVSQRVPDELLEARWRPLFEPRRDPKELLIKVGDGWYLPSQRVLVLESRLF